MLEFKNITKTFTSDLFKKNFTALRDLSFKVEENTIVGFLGANGAGKTTSLKIALDFIRPSKGEVSFHGLGKNKLEIFSNIGFLPERPYFYPHLTGKDFCFYMGSLSGMRKRDIGKAIKQWAPEFNIEFALDREIKTYSKGMLQRIGFLATLLHDPRLIILDEPLSGVDPIGRKELKDIITRVHKLGKTIFFSSHIVSDLEEICSNVIFLKDGELVFQGKVDDIITRNIKPESIIRYSDGKDYHNLLVKNDEKNEKLKILLKKGMDIISITQDRPSLEKIFYNVN